MTMPSSGTITLTDACLEFYGVSGGLGITDMYAQTGGSSTIAPSPRNDLNSSIPQSIAGSIGLTNLYAGSGANVLSIAKTLGSGVVTGPGATAYTTITNLTGTPFTSVDVTVSIPSGLTINSVSPIVSNVQTLSGSLAGVGFSVGTATSVTANTWKFSADLTGKNPGPGNSGRVSYSVTITDSTARVRNLLFYIDWIG